MIVAITKHPYTDVIKYKYGGYRHREMIAEISSVCLVCKRHKENHDRIRIDNYE